MIGSHRNRLFVFVIVFSNATWAVAAEKTAPSAPRFRLGHPDDFDRRVEDA